MGSATISAADMLFLWYHSIWYSLHRARADIYTDYIIAHAKIMPVKKLVAVN